MESEKDIVKLKQISYQFNGLVVDVLKHKRSETELYNYYDHTLKTIDIDQRTDVIVDFLDKVYCKLIDVIPNIMLEVFIPYWRLTLNMAKIFSLMLKFKHIESTHLEHYIKHYMKHNYFVSVANIIEGYNMYRRQIIDFLDNERQKYINLCIFPDD